MLVQFRSFARSLGTKILLGLLIVTFGVWGVEDMLKQSAGSTNVAEVGDINITAYEYKKALYEESEKLRQMLGKQFSPQLLANFNFGPQILQKLVDSRLLVMESRSLGLRISDEEIANNIRKKPEFMDNKGRFNKISFDNYLKRNGISEKQYIQNLRDDMGVMLLLSTLGTAVPMPANVGVTLLKSKGEQRSVELYSITPAMLKSIPAASEEQLKDYYEAHKDGFTAPEYRTLSYITVSTDDAKKQVKVLEKNDREKQDIENIYRERIEEFKKPERRNVDQLLFGNEEAAKKAHASLISGKSFEEVGKESNILNPKTIPLGLVEKSSLMEEAADKVFLLNKGGISEPIKSSFGWHIFQVREIVPISTLSLEEVRPQLEKELEQQAQDNALTELSNKLEDSIAGGASLAETAKEFDLKLVTLPPADKNGKLADGSPEKSLPDDGKFLETAFKTDEKSESAMINGKNGKNYILRVEKVTHEHLLPFAEVKSKVSEAWVKEEKKKQLAEIAKKIASAFADPAKRSATISSYGLPAPTIVTVSQKKEEVKKLPVNVISDIFIRNIGDSTSEFETADGNFGIAVLKSVTTDTLSEKDPGYASQLAETVKEYNSSVQNEIIEQYLRFLATRYTISVNAAAVEAVAKSESGL